MSDELLKSIEQMARLQENIKYPRNVVAGSDLFYERRVFIRRVYLTEKIILRMTRAIVDESWDWDAKGTPRAKFDYAGWLATWEASGRSTIDPDLEK